MGAIDDYFASLTRNISNLVNSFVIARVIRVDNTNRFVDVEPLTSFLSENGDVEELPPLINIPVAVFGNETFVINIPTKIGDTVMVLFCDHDIENLLISGVKSTPNTDRIHDLNDAIAMPFSIKFLTGNNVPNLSDAYIGNKSGGTFISLTESGDINIRSDNNVNVDCENYNVTERS